MDIKNDPKAFAHPDQSGDVTSDLRDGHGAGSAHTPGPWTITRSNFITYIKADTGHKEIAVMYVDSGVDKQANASLISSAPELLQALKASIDVIQLMQEWARQVSPQYLDGDRQTRFDYAADMQSASEAVRLYRAFISKAEGKS